MDFYQGGKNMQMFDIVTSHPAQTALCCATAVIVMGAAVMLKLRKNRAPVTAPFFFTVFLSVFCLYCPMTGSLLYGDPDVELSVLGRFAITFYHTFKVFAGDGNFAAVREWLTETVQISEIIRHLYEGLFIVLCVAAIISVTGIILSFFKDFFARVRFYICEIKAYLSAISNWKKLKNPRRNNCLPTDDFYTIYFFSELNSKSLALAEDIKNSKKRGAFVFFDVYEENEENSAEIRDRAMRLGAILFKKDILSFKSNLDRKTGSYIRSRVEFFLIGANESENISQAIELTNRYKSRYNTQIFVWAGSAESAVVLDSVEKIDRISGNKKNSDIDNPYSFKLRRVDDVERYTRRALEEADLFRDKNGETRDFISMLIVGMGETGREFLKTAVWMYQMEGVRLEINTVDITDRTSKILYAQCPGLLDMNDCTIAGEAHYSIRILDNVNIFEDDVTDKTSFRKLLLDDSLSGNELAQRLRRTTDVFIALGDDDLNIRGAMELRTLFERIKYKGFCKERPRIITQVYDTLKSQDIMSDDKCILATYQGTKFDINIKGSLSEQYSYSSVNRNSEEEEAIQHHLQWRKTEEITGKIKEYNQYEYFRRSSIAKACHKKMTERCFASELVCVHKNKDAAKSHTRNEQIEELRREETCDCQACYRSRSVEHMRWNAYMRAQGYIQPPENYAGQEIKDAIAKYHSKLVTYDNLDEKDRKKDSSLS